MLSSGRWPAKWVIFGTESELYNGKLGGRFQLGNDGNQTLCWLLHRDPDPRNHGIDKENNILITCNT